MYQLKVVFVFELNKLKKCSYFPPREPTTQTQLTSAPAEHCPLLVALNPQLRSQPQQVKFTTRS